ncbi:MAG: hypothetical protein AAF573_14680, partial [Bacteroidota bacterium]
MKFYYLCFFMIFFNCNLFAQEGHKRDYVWLRGYDANYYQNASGEGTIINFNEDIVAFEFIENDMNFNQMNASISDPLGNLLFYTNGCYVADASHQIMERGDSLNYPGEVYDNNCLDGDGYTLNQG